MFGITDGKETKPGEWAEIPPIPDNDSKITFCTCDTNGTYFIVICENETVYFRGTYLLLTLDQLSAIIPRYSHVQDMHLYNTLMLSMHL